MSTPETWKCLSSVEYKTSLSDLQKFGLLRQEQIRSSHQISFFPRDIETLIFMRQLHSFLFLLGFSSSVSAQTSCKSTPQDANWPTSSEWKALNQSLSGRLIRTSPAASSCYAGNPFNAHTNCSDVTQHWSYAAHHAEWPESVDYSVWTNNSCLPPGVSGYMKGRGCSIGALPQYIVNATTDSQVATAMKWATDRNIRIAIKGTGHDLSGR